MQKTTRKLIFLPLAVLILMGLLFQTTLAGEDAVTVTIYHTNDIHGYVEHKINEETGAVERLGLDYVAARKADTENALLVDAGDFSQGYLFANISNGQSVIEVMGAAGYNLAALGNHEFDHLMEQLDGNIAAAAFPTLSANIAVDAAHAETYPNLAAMPSYVLEEIAGKKIAFFALNTPELKGLITPAKLADAGITVNTDLTGLATDLVAQIRAEHADVDAIIALAHCGYAEDAQIPSSLAIAAVDGVDAVIDAHDHQLRLGDAAQNVDGTLVVSTGTQMTALGKLELTFTGDKLAITSSDALEDAAALEPDAAVTAVINRWNESLAEMKTTVALYSEVNLWGGNVDGYTAADEEIRASIARRGSTNAGALVIDARVWRAQNWLAENYADPFYAEYGLTPDMPVVGMNGGGTVRGSALAGDMTLADIMQVYPYGFDNA